MVEAQGQHSSTRSLNEWVTKHTESLNGVRLPALNKLWIYQSNFGYHWMFRICFIVQNLADFIFKWWQYLIMLLQSNIGILALLDEECLRPGNPTDLTFLEKLNHACQNHLHYENKALKKCQNDKTLAHGTFRLKHYAGNVGPCKFTCMYIYSGTRLLCSQIDRLLCRNFKAQSHLLNKPISNMVSMLSRDATIWYYA